eukprot:TRINITY_DN58035_c0_g1_i1.p1 TRINITY_DN58035_c0_g1~~TRINITY_DN58035_c0_g1_i1.p1  ORF type:complete len:189 (+),score=27.90 TRINITY_DN58035_c0_g1_i1:67-567(+)
MGWYDKCMDSLRGDGQSVADGLCGGINGEGELNARLRCWWVMGSKDMPDHARAKICIEAAPSATNDELLSKAACWERVTWRGRSDRKFEISEDDAGTLCRRVVNRHDSESVQTCWKERAFDSYRSAALRMPSHDAAVICSDPSVDKQRQDLLDYVSRAHRPSHPVI